MMPGGFFQTINLFIRLLGKGSVWNNTKYTFLKPVTFFLFTTYALIGCFISLSLAQTVATDQTPLAPQKNQLLLELPEANAKNQSLSMSPAGINEINNKKLVPSPAFSEKAKKNSVLPVKTSSDAPVTKAKVNSTIVSVEMPLPNTKNMPLDTVAQLKTAKETEIKTDKRQKPLVTEPAHNTKTTIMFDSDEMAIVEQIIEAYDSYDGQIKIQNPAKDANAEILDVFNAKKIASNEHEENHNKLPNIYLGSIIYDSPQEWAVIVNSKKFVSFNNNPANEFYISRISRKEIELIWKPYNFGRFASKFSSLTDLQRKNMGNIKVAEQKSAIILLIKPNQTFLSENIMFHEGLVKQNFMSATVLTENKNLLESK